MQENLTNLSTIRRLCEQYGFSLSKGFGQNFLVNPSVCPRICDAAGLSAHSQVLEIGPGFGTLTQELCRRAGKVVSIEVDRRLQPVLDETMAKFSNLQIVFEDVLKADLHALFAASFSGPATVCANLPYNITSPVLMRLLTENLPIARLVVMVQKEAAERITAAPGTRAAGAISYAAHYYSTPKYLFTVSPGSFYPPPRVKSAVIQLEVKPTPALSGQPQRQQRLFSLIRAAFGQRRKTLLNAASAGLGLPKPQLQAALDAAGIPPSARPEQLELPQYILLEKAIWPDE